MNTVSTVMSERRARAKVHVAQRPLGGGTLAGSAVAAGTRTETQRRGLTGLVPQVTYGESAVASRVTTWSNVASSSVSSECQ